MLKIKSKKIYTTADFSGTEGLLYIKSDTLHKIYFYPELYDYNKLIELKKRQSHIKLTTMPLDGIFLNDKFIGIVLKYFDSYESLGKFELDSIENKIYLMRQIGLRLQELTDNSIYPMDLHRDNILVSKKGNVELIDLDGYDVKLTNTPNKGLLGEVLEQYRALIITYLYNQQFANIRFCGSKIGRILRELDIDNSLISPLIGSNLDYDILHEFIDYTEKVKKLK